MVAVAALLLNALLAGPPRLRRALRTQAAASAVAHIIRTLERKLNRERRPPAERRMRGTLLCIAALFVSLLLGVAAEWLAFSLDYGAALEAVVLAALLGLRQSADRAQHEASRLERGEAALLRDELLEGGIWRNAALLDPYAMARAGVETVMVDLNERLVSPVLWYVLFGLPGLFATRIITLLTAVLTPAGEAFGATAWRVARLVHYPPALLTGIWIAAASLFLPFGRPVASVSRLFFTAGTGEPRRIILATAGGALNLALGGPLSVYAGGSWLGGAVAKAYPRDMRRAVWLSWTCALLLGLGLAAL